MYQGLLKDNKIYKTSNGGLGRVSNAPSGSWNTLFIAGTPISMYNFYEYNLRLIFKPSMSGSKIRVTFENAAVPSAFCIRGISIVERDGSTCNGTAIPTEIKFNGITGISDAIGDATYTSDELTYTIDSSKEYLICFDNGGTGNPNSIQYYGDSNGWGIYNVATASYLEQNVSASLTAWGYVGIQKIEVFG